MIEPRDRREDHFSPRILLMDDEASVRRVTTALLSSLGCTVESATGGEQALKLYVEARTGGRPYDLVMADLTVVGGMGGAELARRIIALDANARILLCSGHPREKIDGPIEADFLRKPYTVDELIVAIEATLADQPQRA